jgi:hypothetical protein
MQTEADPVHPGQPTRGSRLLWWHLVLIACAVVVALSSVVIASAELRQARYLRQANCHDRAQAGGTHPQGTPDIERELRRCLGLPEEP